ncbi:DUF4350 domain-containing protein [Pseudomonas sp. LS1212]|uniref:DUF4350 domain-containing protein n=1 Tax=Pseudomonas sp. LS1212 TaxID=2972478 RepID=UPI00215C1A04|nr:DUF4350 domain-containing protein [Pseudomonas sp. LS1212]UVJ43177.1 DUF4350 domain-containing protein [Pseudomonas sp. LS1212]
MIRRPAVVLGLLLCLAIGLFATYLYRHLQPYQAIIEHGPSPEAQNNPYLAAEQFMRQRGLVVARADGLDVLPQLPPARSSLLLLGNRQQMAPGQVEQLLHWVVAGGRLLFVAEALWDEDRGASGDLLLDRLNLRQYLSADLPQASAEPEQTFPRLTQFYPKNEQAPAYFSFDPDYHLEDPDKQASSRASSGVSTHMMQLPYGLGLITVVTDSELWHNRAIGRYDNAWLLWYLNQGRKVTLVMRAEHEDLLTLLLRHFPQALAALLMLIVLLVWRLAMRQGPVRQPPPLARRQLQEHLSASADFLLRHNGQATLIQALQQDILRRARHRHPGFERLGEAEQRQVLARLTQQPAQAIGQALSPPLEHRLSSTDFSHQVAHLQSLRNAL